jgi:hypothetical protein
LAYFIAINLACNKLPGAMPGNFLISKGNVMSNTSVQLEGVESVLEVYASRRIPAFAIFQGRNLNFSYEGNDLNEGAADLEQWLTAIKKSNATYTIKFYDQKDIKSGIRANTPDRGALNFRLNLEPIGGREAAVAGVSYDLMRRLDDIERRNEEILQRLEEGEDDVEPQPDQNNIIGTIKALAEIPGFQQIVAGLLSAVAKPAQVSSAAIGNIPTTGTMKQQETINEAPDITQEEVNRAVTAYVTIRESYPGFLDMLEQIAAKATDDPSGVASKLSMAKTFL